MQTSSLNSIHTINHFDTSKSQAYNKHKITIINVVKFTITSNPPHYISSFQVPWKLIGISCGVSSFVTSSMVLVSTMYTSLTCLF